MNLYDVTYPDKIVNDIGQYIDSFLLVAGTVVFVPFRLIKCLLSGMPYSLHYSSAAQG